MKHSTLTLGAAALLLAATTSNAEFRVNPYLQQPTTDGMLVTWFTEADIAGEIVVSGGDLAAPLVWSSTPMYQPLLEYTQAELDQGASGLDLFASSNNYKHSVRVSGLSPDTEYLYTVTQGQVEASGRIKTAPTASDWQSIRFIALADSETQPQGRTTFRAWIEPPQAAASEGRPLDLPISNAAGENFAPGYLLTETEGYKQNLRIVGERNPDFIVMPGDIVQGGGYQPGWDEFFRHNAGIFDSPLSNAPILPAFGNWENFGALNGGYAITPGTVDSATVELDPTNAGDTSVNAPFIGRSKYKVYFDQPANGTADHQDNYYRVDFGPITVLTLDSSNGEPDVTVLDDPTVADTDTQSNFTRAEFEAAGGTGLSDFNESSTQWDWVEAQLQDARQKGQIIFIQYHHIAYSTGRHAIPPGEFFASGQSGTPLRSYQPMFETYGVVSVLSGHNEQFERSFVDLDDNGVGTH